MTLGGPGDTAAPEWRLRYARQIALQEIGTAGQTRLAQSRVMIVGLGGLGCPAALTLASSGVGNLVLADFDRVDLTNLPRQPLYATQDVGRPKVQAAADTLRARQAGIELDIYAERLSGPRLHEVLGSCDVLLDCSDNFPSRYELNAAAWATGTPLVSAAAIRFEGQLAVFRGDLGRGPCYRCLYPEPPEELGDCAGQGVFTPLVGMLGTWQAGEALKLLLAAGNDAGGRLMLFDGLDGHWREIRIAALTGCPVCSSN